MFHAKSRQRDATVRNRKLRSIVRLTHDTLVRDLSAKGPVGFEPSPASTAVGDQPWDDLVFEGRNREYGAYVLRKGYSRNIMIGLGITILVVLFLIFYPAISGLWRSDKTVSQASPRKLVYSELSIPPPIDKPKPLPPRIQLPKLKKVLKFVPPKVVKEEVAELTPALDEIKENDIGAVAVEGPADVVFDEPVEEVVAEDNELFTVVDQQPEFEGGYEAMMAFIKKHMVYPPNARRMQIEGTVHLSFIVSKTGAISEVKVLRGIMTECDREAVRVVQMMPAWKPGKQNGRNVNVRFILPLKFRMN